MTIRKPNKAILEHEQKRAVEVKCVELQEVLENQGWDFTFTIYFILTLQELVENQGRDLSKKI